MKLRNKKGLVLGVVALSAVAITSVGFAAWVISQGDTEAVNGQITVDSVSDERHNIQIAKLVSAVDSTTDAANTNVVYGTNANGTSGWLRNADGPLENLTFYLYVKVENVDAGDTVASIIPTAPVIASTGGGSVEVSSTTYTGYAGAASAVYTGSGDKSLVGALPTATASATNFTANGEAWYTINFTWGTFTSGTNPYSYYNALTAEAKGDEAMDCLGKLNTLLTGATYTITVTTVA